ncbi:MAG: 2-polyprenyl-3-methyl-6-methoxy-1,4-benzoquinone monooxygenase [Gammaproteobacteria bacterium]|nr:2-polyprenyl-3-methyl-6-methoxy-1,4-benzoquinone monooxygenase [Gammaproteobacteria bacterium]MBU1645702.1 2-polyprenyl-3-methyl-6-methoxy-1,4-benzoquinone monooxygenase [Gammaproteobacteria bacterium]MBU1970807.1 2-polyprenyl-3-methyl-6-methoxy-1,4-benzoquinone monooxygenase [Gammaproteobacteria bacterium]
MIDQFILEFDKALRTVFAHAPTRRPMPGADIPEADMGDAERQHAAALMRVNHCGEVCAQALYQGQALTSHDPAVKVAMEAAAWEETEHLNWTERRIAELGGHKSLLNPLWYAGSLAMGIAAGKFGDAWNLGFLAETERQVEAHLDSHLAALPENDRRSWAILEQMKADEVRHAETAVRMGAHDLPSPIKAVMRLSSTVMTTLSYRV